MFKDPILPLKAFCLMFNNKNFTINLVVSKKTSTFVVYKTTKPWEQ